MTLVGSAYRLVTVGPGPLTGALELFLGILAIAGMLGLYQAIQWWFLRD